MKKMSFKNALQELYQKSQPHAVLPVYHHRRAGDASGGWLSTVKLPDGIEFYSELQPTKKMADQQAAQHAYNHLMTQQHPLKSRVQEPKMPALIDDAQKVEGERVMIVGSRDLQVFPPTIVFIDLENAPRYTNEMYDRVLFEGVRFEAYVGWLSSQAAKGRMALHALYPWINELHIVESNAKDAVDHAITFDAGRWWTQMERGERYERHLIIVSRDAFVGALLDTLRQRHAATARASLSFSQAPSLDLCFDLLQELKSVDQKKYKRST